MTRNALDIGKAAEHLVCADLLLAGYRAFLSDQGLPYDVLLDDGGRLLRIQVKAKLKEGSIDSRARGQMRRGYNFHVRRRGKNGASERLTDEHCDIVALVALDVRAVAYLPIFDVGQTCDLMPASFEPKGRYQRRLAVRIIDFPIGDALIRLRSGPSAGALPKKRDLYEFRGQLASLPVHAAKTGINISTVHRRIGMGWTIERALSVPPSNGARHD